MKRLNEYVMHAKGLEYCLAHNKYSIMIGAEGRTAAAVVISISFNNNYISSNNIK